MKTIKQLSEELKISKEAIYKKIKFQLKQQLEGHIIKLNNVTHIDDEGERIIIQSLNWERQEAIQDIISSEITASNEHTSDIQLGNQPHVTEFISILQEQVKTKDIQLETQNNHITQLIKQLGNNQYLLQAEQYKNVLYLQAEAVATGKPVQYKPIPFWKRIFKR